ncbi:MAG TPA: hypothetical protein VNU01_02940 [Egibacteraceae bacterium]|nr:hypothetical protein [Egibacteraceae bacterium]
MQLDEQTRHEVFGTLRDKLGETAAVVLMGAIPPFDWSEVATKSDLYAMEERLTDRFTGRMYRAMFFQTLGLFGANVALISAFAR